MKINEVDWVAGCSCCQPYEEAVISVRGIRAHCIKVQQEDESYRYTVIIGDGQERHMKLTESDASSVLSKIGT